MVALRHARAVAERVLDRQRLLVPRLGGGEIAAELRHHAELVVDTAQPAIALFAGGAASNAGRMAS